MLCIFSRPWWILSLFSLCLVSLASLASLSSLQTFLPDSQQVLTHELVKDKAKTRFCDATPKGPIEITLCDYESVESVNDELFATLRDLVQTPFFRYFQVDLYRECPFWHENGFCMSRECAITTVDESQIPIKWRAATLSKLDPPSDQRITLPGCYYRDSDFCFLDDHTEGDYFDLSLVPERYTGYAGPSAHRVWSSIYEENCFGLSELDLSSHEAAAGLIMGLPDTMGGGVEGTKAKVEEGDEVCLEKRIYYKIISGLHASISTHICYDYLDQTTGSWSPSLPCFLDRVASHPERLRSIYFNTVLLLRAVSRIGPYLRAYDYCSTGTHEEDVATWEKLGIVVETARDAGRFDERRVFRGVGAELLKEEFKVHFRNVSRIMDCVGCDKCRLWGKVQVTGLATALKILFELDEKALDPHTNPNLLQRSEVVALIHTLHRFSESLKAYEKFREIWKEETLTRQADVGGGLGGESKEDRQTTARWLQEQAEGVMRDSWERLRRIFEGSGENGRSAEEL